MAASALFGSITVGEKDPNVVRKREGKKETSLGNLAPPTLSSRNLRSKRRTSARWTSFLTYAQPPSPLHVYIRYIVPMLVGVEPGLRVLRRMRSLAG
jgi:hypothetical protein